MDHNGTLTVDELCNLCNDMGLPMEVDEEEAMFKMDTDGSGGLSIEEWCSWWLKRVSCLPNPAKQQEAMAQNTFNKFDADQSGSIDASELENIISALGADFSPKELQQAMLELDGDGNGTLDREEFTAWWCARANGNRSGGSSIIALKLKKLAKKASRIFYTDIHTACWKGDEALVKMFLESEGRLANAIDDSEYGDHWSPLHYAAYKGFCFCSICSFHYITVTWEFVRVYGDSKEFVRGRC